MAEERNPSPFSVEASPAGESFRLLCDVGVALSTSADAESALTRLAARVAGSAADLCTVDVLMPDGTVVRQAAEHGSPDLARLARELRRFPPEPDEPDDALGRVMAEGETVRVADLEGGWLDSGLPDGEHREILRALGIRALVAAPLLVRGRVLGLLTLGWVDPGGRCAAEDVALAEELGRRAALAVDYERLLGDGAGRGPEQTRFLASMSHEFRTPVHIASMFAELLLMGVPEPIPPAARAQVEHIRTATRHLDHLVEQVLSFARLQAGKESVRAEPVDLVGLTRQTAGLIEPLARQKGIGFTTELPAAGVVALTDPNRLRQILFNLLGNAVKFTETGEVRLRLRLADERVIFEVTDTGIGIDPEHRDRIFEPFWRVDSELRAEAGGTGLGLGIVKQLVRLLEGEVAVESAPGTGSVFRVLLPLRRARV